MPRRSPASYLQAIEYRRVGLPLLLLLAAFAFPPPDAGGAHLLHIPNLCLFHRLTGYPCPGCGLTRSIVCIGHGRIQESFAFHPLGIAIFAYLVVAAASRLVNRPILLSPRLLSAGALTATAAFIFVGIGRLFHLLPWPP